MTPLLTIEQVAELLDCSRDTVTGRLARNELPGVKYGRSWRIPADALHQHLTAEAMRHLLRHQLSDESLCHLIWRRGWEAAEREWREPLTQKEIKMLATYMPEGVSDDDVECLVRKVEQMHGLTSNAPSSPAAQQSGAKKG